jgi:carbon starvation protein
MIPLLFVTIACGGVSGFHSLVSSGTTVTQLNREKDAVLIGYGAMLVEGALALLVIAACTAGLSAVD